MVQMVFLFIFLSECNAAIHKKCIDKIIGRCTGTAANSRDTVVWITYLFCTLCPVRLAHFRPFSLSLVLGIFAQASLGHSGACQQDPHLMRLFLTNIDR